MSNIHNKKIIQQKRRSARTRARLFGTTLRPRLSVHKSNTHIYAQLIDDEKGVTVTASSDVMLKISKKKLMERAELVGTDIAEKAKKLNVNHAVFDRGGLLYTGVIKMLADSARKGGLQF